MKEKEFFSSLCSIFVFKVNCSWVGWDFLVTLEGKKDKCWQNLQRENNEKGEHFEMITLMSY